MDHVAIMKKSWGLTEKILRGVKTIESRWYATRHRPWDRMHAGDIVYFKNTGEPVQVRTEVERVMQFADLTPHRVKEILTAHGERIGIEKDNIAKFYERCEGKKYCILVFLKNIMAVKPFEIDKTGFGAMSAWLTVKSVASIKISMPTA